MTEVSKPRQATQSRCEGCDILVGEGHLYNTLMPHPVMPGLRVCQECCDVVELRDRLAGEQWHECWVQVKHQKYPRSLGDWCENNLECRGCEKQKEA